jgi:hypothetical protein
LKATFNLPEYTDEKWAQELHAGVEKLSIKLQKYYDKTNAPFVYPDSCLLEPKGKDILFKQKTFGGGGSRVIYRSKKPDRLTDVYPTHDKSGSGQDAMLNAMIRIR